MTVMCHSATLLFAAVLSMTGLARADILVPAVYVLDAAGRVAASFGYPGTAGRECRSDSDEVPDGAFMPCRRLPGIDDPAMARELCLEKSLTHYQGWEGYHRGHEIANNEIRHCRRGIVLHRAAGIRIHGNRVGGRGVGEGIALEEASATHVWNNRVRGFVTACTLYAHSHSATAEEGMLVGASGNHIGLTPAGDSRGNDFRNNQRGIALIKADPAGRVSAKLFAANDCRDCPVPFDFSGGEDRPGGQTVADNLPAAAQQALPSSKLSAAPR